MAATLTFDIKWHDRGVTSGMIGLGRRADKTADKIKSVGRAGADADESLGSLRGNITGLGAGLLGAVKPFAAFAATTASVGAAAVPAGLALGKLALAGVQAGVSLAPLAASVPAVAGGLVFLRATVTSTGPAMVKALDPVTKAFTKGQTEVDKLATKGLPSLAKGFVRVNFPAIHSAMSEIAEAQNGVVTGVGKWINSAHGQEAIRTVVEGISGAVSELRPEITGLAISVGELIRRGGDKGIDLLATGFQRAASTVKNLIDGISSQDVARAWQSVEGWASRLAGFGKVVVDVGVWMHDNQDKVKSFSDILAGVGIALGVLSGNPIGALIGALTLLTNHWDLVKESVGGAIDWFKKTDGATSTTTSIMRGLKVIVGDLGSWWSNKLMPALRTAGEELFPVLKDAVKDVGDTLHDNRDGIEKVKDLFSAVGVVLTKAVIPAVTMLGKIGIPLLTQQFDGAVTVINRIVLPGIRILSRMVLDFFGAIVNGAADAFGWVPGLGDKLKGAAAKFNTFRDDVNRALSGVKDQKVTVGATIYFSDGTVGFKGSTVKAKAAGGYITGPGGPRDDRVPTLLSNGEFVINAAATRRNRGLLEALNADRMANGGLVVSPALSGLAEAKAAEDRAVSNAVLKRSTKAAAAMVDAAMGAGAPNTGTARAIGRAMAAKYGWTGGQWNALNALWTGESNWNPRAKNPTSTAFGIPQFLKSTAAAYGLTYGDTNPVHQIAAGLKYIAQIYGTPRNAYGKWRSRSPHWYGSGGVINEPVMGVGLRSGQRYGFGERGPETVIPGRLRPGARAAEVHIHLHNNGAIGSEAQLLDWLARGVDKLNRHGRLPRGFRTA